MIQVDEFRIDFALHHSNPLAAKLVELHRTEAIEAFVYRVGDDNKVVCQTGRSQVVAIWLKGQIMHFGVLCFDAVVDPAWVMRGGTKLDSGYVKPLGRVT